MQEFSKQNIIDVLSDLVKGEVLESSDKYILTIKTIKKNEDPLPIEISFSALDEILTRIHSLEVFDETSLVSSRSYEVVVREESTGPIRRIREDLEIKDDENGLLYEVSTSSVAYYIWLMLTVKNHLSLRDFKIGFSSFSVFRRLEGKFESEGEVDFNQLLNILCGMFKTLKITSKKDIGRTQLLKHSHAFLFQIGYNLDTALVPQRFLEEISRRGRINRMRRATIDDIDPPRRTYNESLVHRYLLAVSTDNPVIEYLSYYHILEHFYEAVFNDELLDTVKSKITDPSFSYKRKKDIEKLISVVKKSIQVRSETITFSEYEALKLCLKRYVSITDLDSRLSEYDVSIVEYYKINKVTFSNGSEVNLKSSDQEKIIKNLASRIYSTRNSLVHSKDNDKSKYTPFKDDRILVKEIPLMRFISEMVILSDSSTS